MGCRDRRADHESALGARCSGRTQGPRATSTSSFQPSRRTQVFRKRGWTRPRQSRSIRARRIPFTLTPEEAAAGELYGPLKVLSEQEAEKWFPGKTTIVRPGLIVGPGDPSNRFTYWPVRVARGGEVLAPGDGKDPVQIIDARDLAEWIIRLAEQNVTGMYNATGPKSPLTMGEMVGGIRAVMRW